MPTARRYQGGFVDGQQDGQGTLTAAGRHQLRRRLEGRRQGRPGQHHLPDGATYEGGMADGAP